MKFNNYQLEDLIICYDNKRKPLSAMQRETRKGNYPYYGAQEIIDSIDNFIFDGKYILLAEDGENLRSNVKPIANLVSGKFWLNNHAHIFQTNEKCVLEYLYYLLLNTDIKPYITGTTQPKLNQSNMLKINLKIPNIYYQKQAVKILKNIDKKINLNTHTNNNLYAIANSLLATDFDSNNNIELLHNVIKFIKGKKPIEIVNIKNDNFLKYLTIACINNQEVTYANPEKTIIANNDILMVMDGASSGEVYFSDYGIVGSTLAKIDIINDNYTKEYVFFVLKKYSEIIKNKNTGSAIPHTDKAFINTLGIPIIKVENQEKYKIILDRIQHNLIENINLANIRATLLPKLMNGEIDLDKVEI